MGPYDDLSLLKAFICIVESRSISAGARRLHIPQPTLSRQLRSLEKACGATLIQRDTHGMSLTETGRGLLADARLLLAYADDAEQRLHNDQSELRGHLRLFSTIDFGQSVFTRLVASFIKKNPKVTVELSYNNRPLHMMQEGYDAGLMVGMISDENVVARPAGSVARYIVAAPAFLKSRPAIKNTADLKTLPWLSLFGYLFGGSKTVALFSTKHTKQAFQIAPVLVVEGVTSLREALRTGMGIGILPHWLVKEDLISGRLVRVLPGWSAEEVPVHIVYSSQRILPLRVRAFVEYATSYMARELKAK